MSEAPAAFARRCAGCHIGTAATSGLPQGLRALAVAPEALVGRFAGEHYAAMTGRVLRGDETRAIVETLRALAPTAPPVEPRRVMPGTRP